MVKRVALKPKRIMREFALKEISAVDKPAQTHARMTIMKRDNTDELADAIVKRYIDPMDGARPFSEILEADNAGEHYHRAIEQVSNEIYALDTSIRSIVGDSSLDTASKQLRMRNTVDEFLSTVRVKMPDVEEALQKVILSDDDDVGKGELDMEKEKISIQDLQKQIEDLTKRLEAAEGASEDAKKASELQASLDKLQEELAEKTEALTKAEAEKAEAEELAKLSDDEREFIRAMDDKERKKFLTASADERKAIMQKSATDDETVTVEGRTIRKSVVGEDQFEIFKSQAERIAKQEEELRKEREHRETLEFTKRAEEELTHLPGETTVKAKVLKAVSSLNEEERDALDKMLKAGNKAVESAFNTIGHKGDLAKKTATDFQKRVDEISTRDKCSKTEALAKARKEYPEEFEAFQNAN